MTDGKMKILETVPREPKKYLMNYLLDLVDESDQKGSSIYISDAHSLVQKIWRQIIRNNWRTINVREFIPQNFNMSSSMIYSYKNGNKGIPIQTLRKLIVLWAKYCHKHKREIEIVWDEVFHQNIRFSASSKNIGCALPKSITPELSYFIGWLCGDGHLRSDGCHYLVKISEKSVPQLKTVLRPLIKKLFDINPPIFRTYEGGHAIQFGSKPIYRFLTKVLKIQVGKIPELVTDLDKTNLKYFLRGVFDSEGYVNASYRESAVTISQANFDFLFNLGTLFQELDIYFNEPVLHHTKLGTWYSVGIRKKAEIQRFADLVGSSHLDKSQKLEKVVSEIEKNWLS